MNKLISPVRDVFITQPFGVNYLDFYKKLGLKGHNGIDFRAFRGSPVYASHSGIVQGAGVFGDGGIGVYLLSNTAGDGYKTVYYHLLDVAVKQGDLVKQGQIIGHADNTGTYTTGDHLHFGLKITHDGRTINMGNGYNGAVDPAPYFEDGWDHTPALKRYDREKVWIAEWRMRFKNAWIHRQLIARRRHPLSLTSEEVNAIVYGAWDFESVINPAMAYNWKYLTKEEFLNGKKPFQK